MLLASLLVMTSLGQLVVKSPAIAFKTSEFAAHYGRLRSQQLSKEKGYEDAVKILSELEQVFPDRIIQRNGVTVEAKISGQEKVNELFWRSIDILAFSAGSMEGLDLMSQRISRPIGGSIPVGTVTQSIKQAMHLSKAAFAREWESSRTELSFLIEDWTKAYVMKSDVVLSSIIKRLKFEKAPTSVTILLVPALGGKEGMTMQTPEGIVVVMSAGKHRGSAFAEVAFHETAHVLDSISGEKSVLGRLRANLAKENIPTAVAEQVAHLFIFFASEESVRGMVGDSTYRSVGENEGIYSRFPQHVYSAARRAFFGLEDGEEKALHELAKSLGIHEQMNSRN